MRAGELNFVALSKAIRFTEDVIHSRIKMTNGD